MTAATVPTVAIVGAGLTGLTAAWRLRSAGFNVRVFEKSDVAGGRTLSLRQDGFIFDVGAITMLPTYKETGALIDELGIRDHVHKVAPIIGIPRRGKIHTLDLSRPLRSLFGTGLIAAPDKLRLLKLLPPLLRTWRRSNYRTLSSLEGWDDESVADYVIRELGDEIHEYIAGPIIRGNTLNSTESAPAGEFLWMLRQYAAPFVQNFDSGINFLAETLAKRVSVDFRSEVQSVRKHGKQVILTGVRQGTRFREPCDACVVALTPDALLSLSLDMNARQHEFLESIKPLPSINIHIGLRVRPSISQTFILPPQSEAPDLTTIVMDHLKAPGRAPEGRGVVSLLCRDDWCARNFDRPDKELLSSVLKLAEPYIGDVSGDVESFAIKRWPYAIIKSEPGLYRRIRQYEDEIDVNSRIQVGGDFLSMGMEAAVSSGGEMAARITTILNCPEASENCRKVLSG